MGNKVRELKKGDTVTLLTNPDAARCCLDTLSMWNKYFTPGNTYKVIKNRITGTGVPTVLLEGDNGSYLYVNAHWYGRVKGWDSFIRYCKTASLLRR